MVEGKKGYKGLHKIIVMEAFDDELNSKAKKLGVELSLFEDIEEDGYE